MDIRKIENKDATAAYRPVADIQADLDKVKAELQAAHLELREARSSGKVGAEVGCFARVQNLENAHRTLKLERDAAERTMRAAEREAWEGPLREQLASLERRFIERASRLERLIRGAVAELDQHEQDLAQLAAVTQQGAGLGSSLPTLSPPELMGGRRTPIGSYDEPFVVAARQARRIVQEFDVREGRARVLSWGVRGPRIEYPDGEPRPAA